VDARQQGRSRFSVGVAPGFLFEGVLLPVAQGLPVCVSQEPIEAARQVFQMETDRGSAAGSRPQLFAREADDNRLELLADLEQRVHDRHDLQWNPWYRTTEPDFRIRLHYKPLESVNIQRDDDPDITPAIRAARAGPSSSQLGGLFFSK
jgi:hypothetical protein